MNLHRAKAHMAGAVGFVCAIETAASKSNENATTVFRVNDRISD